MCGYIPLFIGQQETSHGLLSWLLMPVALTLRYAGHEINIPVRLLTHNIHTMRHT